MFRGIFMKEHLSYFSGFLECFTTDWSAKLGPQMRVSVLHPSCDSVPDSLLVHNMDGVEWAVAAYPTFGTATRFQGLSLLMLAIDGAPPTLSCHSFLRNSLLL